MPDWNQPDNYAPIPNPTPPPPMLLNVGDYPNWCAPTAAADLMGYYQVFANSAHFPGTPMTWRQGLWHDGTVELGWHMDTGGWSTAGGPFPPMVGNTMLVNIGPGAVNYAKAAWLSVARAVRIVRHGRLESIPKQRAARGRTAGVARARAYRPAAGKPNVS